MKTVSLHQDPAPGGHMVRFAGDTITFCLFTTSPARGRAFLRTNIGRGHIRRAEIIAAVEDGRPPAAADWHDFTMVPAPGGGFKLSLPLCETGHFEAKTFFLPESGVEPQWVPGDNVTVNVEPADTCCANIIYNAFVRQFGPNISGGFFEAQNQATIDILDQNGYAVIPPSGTFRDLAQRLDFIIGHLGCRLLQLLPVHPTPTTYGRMGRFGSPYAALSFTAVDPALAVFDPQATPLEQFRELIDAVHARGAKIIMDIAVNHTGWAASLHGSHPEWLVRDAEGAIKSPGAWGVRWADLTRLDWQNQKLWQYMANVFLVWCRRGVDGFRCDAGYMIPVAAWIYMIAKVKDQFPDTLFLLEGLGGLMEVTRDLLNRANFNWAYSELFQNYDRAQIEAYLPGANAMAEQEGVLVHYAETHDNPRLAARSQAWAKMRTLLAALCSQQGAFGFANGVEWYASEKIDVHGASSLNWGAEASLVDTLARVATLLKGHPAFKPQTHLQLMQQGHGNYMVLLRHHLPSGKKLLVAANLDDQIPVSATWRTDTAGMNTSAHLDLLSGQTVMVETEGPMARMDLAPGQVVCLTPDETDLQMTASDPTHLPASCGHQRSRAKVLALFAAARGLDGLSTVPDFDPDQAANALLADPVAYGHKHQPASLCPPFVIWRWPRDGKRQVMVPPGHGLLVTADICFTLRLVAENKTLASENGLAASNGQWFVWLEPQATPAKARPCGLELTVFEAGCHAAEGAGASRDARAPLLYLCSGKRLAVPNLLTRRRIQRRRFVFLSTNGRGAMVHTPVKWGRLYSRYDALLAANPHAEVPVDRWIMLSRVRVWVVFQDYSQALESEILEQFSIGARRQAVWSFRVPAGCGLHLHLRLSLKMAPGINGIDLVMTRRPAGDNPKHLADALPVRLILRPDIENRSFHDTTKAYLGPEQAFPAAVSTVKGGICFAPDQTHALYLRCTAAQYVSEPEWYYQIHRPLEAERGLDDQSDLFSPGYFSLNLAGGRRAVLSADVGSGPRAESPGKKTAAEKMDVPAPKKIDFESLLRAAVNDFVVARSDLKSVVAGYPWFLDWGRDALIFTRGLVAAGELDTAAAVIRQFARFEKGGTLPNMIQGDNAANRDTSDAPLWLLVACRDLVHAAGNDDFLEQDCGGRDVRKIVGAVLEAYSTQTLNHIRMDETSGLIYSPAHYTWMDTNHPAGTPRQGYPIEIQALWLAALEFGARIAAGKNAARWRDLARQVKESIVQLFYRPDEGYLSDCRHAPRFVPAGEAEADDALRPNQLLAVTLGAVDASTLGRAVVEACRVLLVPGAIRSLADAPVKRPLAIQKNGQNLNDPHHPYQGHYQGEEDRQRKPAYHNGTAWVWLFPSFCEAYRLAYGPAARGTARALLGSGRVLLKDGVVGHMPEIVDGDYPHKARGCDAQAWSVSEYLRVLLML